MKIRVPKAFTTHPAISKAYRLGYQDQVEGRTRELCGLPSGIAFAYLAGSLDAI